MYHNKLNQSKELRVQKRFHLKQHPLVQLQNIGITHLHLNLKSIIFNYLQSKKHNLKIYLKLMKLVYRDNYRYLKKRKHLNQNQDSINIIMTKTKNLRKAYSKHCLPNLIDQARKNHIMMDRYLSKKTMNLTSKNPQMMYYLLLLPNHQT